MPTRLYKCSLTIGALNNACTQNVGALSPSLPFNLFLDTMIISYGHLEGGASHQCPSVIGVTSYGSTN